MWLALLLACTPTTTPPPDAEPAADLLPLPEPRDAVRARLQVGSRAVVEWTEHAAPPRKITWVVTGVDDVGVTQRTTVDTGGIGIEPSTEEGTVTWEAREALLTLPADRTVVTEEELLLRFGTFPARRYTVTEPQPGRETRYWYVDAIPGTWALTVQLADGEEVAHAEVVEWDPGPLPPPFSAAEIRDAMPAGTVVRWAVTDMSGTRTVEWEVVSASPSGMRLHITRSGSDDTNPPPDEQSLTWEQLEDHGRLPHGTTRDETTVEVEAGTFTAWRYTRDEGDRETVHWFAPDHPGPPVLTVRSRRGQEEYRMELVAWHRP